MNLQIIFIGLALLFNNLSFMQCAERSLDTSKLPKEMPADVSMSFEETGGMVNAHKHISVKNKVLTYDEKLANEPSPRKWTAQISNEDQEKLYRVFVENKFDLIKADKMEGVVTDAPSRGIFISFGAQSFYIYGDMNSPLSGDNKTRFANVENAMILLAAQYANKAQNASEK
jgi:hypothetical protein